MVEELKSQMRKLENLIGCKGKVDVTSRAFTKELIRALDDKYKSDLKSSIRLRRLEFYHDLIENARLMQKKSVDIEEKFVMSEKKEKEADDDEDKVEEPVDTEVEEVQAVDGDEVVVKAEEVDEWKDLMTLAKIYYLMEHPYSEGLSWKRRFTKKKSIKKFTDKDLIEWHVAQHFRLKGLEEWALSRQEARKLAENSPYNFDDLLEDDESRELEDMFHLLETQKQSKRKPTKLEKVLDAKRPFRYTDECMEDWTESYSDDSEESGADELFDEILDISEEPDMKFDGYHAPGQEEPSFDDDTTETFSTYREIPKYRNPIFDEMDETETMEEWYSLCDEAVGTTKKPMAPPKIVFSFDDDETFDGSLQRPQGMEVAESDLEEYDTDKEMELFLDEEDYSSDKTLSDKEGSDIEGKEPTGDEFDQQSHSAATEEVNDGTISQADVETLGKMITFVEDPDSNQATFIISKTDSPGGIDSSKVQKRSISLADKESIQKDISSIIEEAKSGALNETAAILASTDDAGYKDKVNVVGTGKDIDTIPGISEKGVTQVESATSTIEKETSKEIKSMEEESLDKTEFTIKRGKVADESPIEDESLDEANFRRSADVADESPEKSMEDPDLNQATFIIGKSDPPGGIDSSNVQKHSISLVDEETIQKDISSIIEEAKPGALDETAAILASTDDAGYEDKENVGNGKDIASSAGASEKSVKQVESATSAVEKEMAKEIKPTSQTDAEASGKTSTIRSMEDPKLDQATFNIGKRDPSGDIDSSNVQKRSTSLANEEAIEKYISSIIEEAKPGALDETAAILASTDDPGYEDKENVGTEKDKANTQEISGKSVKEVESSTFAVGKETAKEIKSMEDDSLDKANFAIKRVDAADVSPMRSMEDEDLDEVTFTIGKSDPSGIDMTQTRRGTVSKTDEKGLEEELKSILDEAKYEALDRTVSIVATEDVVGPKFKTDERHNAPTTNQPKTDEARKVVTEDAKEERKQSIKALIEEAKDLALDKTISKIIEEESKKTTTTNQSKTDESNKVVTEDAKEERKQSIKALIEEAKDIALDKTISKIAEDKGKDK